MPGLCNWKSLNCCEFYDLLSRAISNTWSSTGDLLLWESLPRKGRRRSPGLILEQWAPKSELDPQVSSSKYRCMQNVYIMSCSPGGPPEYNKSLTSVGHQRQAGSKITRSIRRSKDVPCKGRPKRLNSFQTIEQETTVFSQTSWHQATWLKAGLSVEMKYKESRLLSRTLTWVLWI